MGGAALYVLGMFIPSYVGGLFSFLGLATLIYTLFRMFSRNTARRTAENAWFWNKTAKLRTAFSQARVRFKNRKEYKYFRCPQVPRLAEAQARLGRGHAHLRQVQARLQGQGIVCSAM